MTNETFALLLPELFLLFVATFIYLAGTYVHDRTIWSGVATIGLLMTAVVLVLSPARSEATISMSSELWANINVENAAARLDLAEPVSKDMLSHFGRVLSLGLGLLFVLSCGRTADGGQAPEFYGTLVLLVLGMMLTAAARDMILLFIGIELITIPTYVLLYLARPTRSTDKLTEESAAKYFFLSVFATALMLYGMSFLYGATGETNLVFVYNKLAAGDGALYSSALVKVALLFIVAGLSFKITAVPFHFYAPDVYQGTSNAAAGVLSVAPKLAGFVALARLAAFAMPGAEIYAWRIFLILSMLTMTVGNVLALRQDNVRRMMAYSSIAHAGYMLIGLCALSAAESQQVGAAGGSVNPFGATLFYLAVYGVSTVGLFSILNYLGDEHKQIDHVDDLAGLVSHQPAAAIALAIFLFSLAGIPPLAGFWGKFGLFYAALDFQGGEAAGSIRFWLIALAVVGAVNAAIAAGYYLRLMGLMFFRSPVHLSTARGGGGALVGGLVCAVLVIALGAFPRELNNAAQEAGKLGQRFAQVRAVRTATGPLVAAAPPAPAEQPLAQAAAK